MLGMNRKDAIAAGEDASVLRILSGPLKSAEKRLADDQAFTLGYALRNNIVLRDPSVKGTRVRISLENGLAEVEIVTGTLRLFGQGFEAPAKIILPAFTPARIGNCSFAVGGAEETRWQECEALLSHSLMAVPAPAEPAPARIPGRRFPAIPGLGKRHALAAGAAFASFFVVIAATGLQKDVQIDRFESLHTALSDEAYANLQVTTLSDGRFRISGFLQEDRELADLEQRLMNASVPAHLDIETGDQLAAKVEDIFRSNGVTAKIEHVEDGKIIATGIVATSEKIEDIREHVRKDVPSSGELAIRYSLPPEAEDPASPVRHDPGKRIVSVVGGKHGYVLTDDGSSYFVGGVLPTGHRITQIDGTDVLVERNGEQIKFQF